jgi:enolase
MFIKEVRPRIILNSRKEKTIEIKLKTYEGTFVCSAPSGKSRGKNEVDPYNEHGIHRSLSLLKKFCNLLRHKNFMIKIIDDLVQLDSLIKQFEKKNEALGGNVLYALHGVFLKAAAKNRGIELWELINNDLNRGKKPKMPMPVGNCVGGGLHSKEISDKRPDFQEFLLIPNEKTFSRAVTVNINAYYHAKRLLKTRFINDENALRTSHTNEEILYIMLKLADKFGLKIGVDVAASSFVKNNYYLYKNKELKRDRLDQIDYIKRLIKKYKLFYVEDPCDEEDFLGFKEILNDYKDKALIVGDDLTTTNPAIVKRAIRGRAINSLIIKPNQIGSLIEVKKVVELCKMNDIKMIFSHRSGETMDNILADYAVGFGANFIKCGIMGRERLIKLKRIIDIEKSLNN